MQPELIKEIEKSPINNYCGILRNQPIKVDIQTIVNHCWIAWSNDFTSEVSDYVTIFEIILKQNGVNLSHLLGFYKDNYLPHISFSNKQTFKFDNELHYLDSLSESNFMDIINWKCNEYQFKNLFTNYLTWLGYTQK